MNYMSAKLTKYEWDEFLLCRIHILHITCKRKRLCMTFFPSWLYVCCTSTPTSSTAKSSYRWGYIGCQDGERIGIEFAELARTDHDLVTFAVEGTVYLRSPVDLMTSSPSPPPPQPLSSWSLIDIFCPLRIPTSLKMGKARGKCSTP